MKWPRSLFVTALACAISATSTFAQDQAQTRRELDFIINQTEASRAALKSFTLDYVREPLHRVGHVVADDTKRYATYHEPVHVGSPQGPERRTDIVSVVNDDYAVIWDRSDNNPPMQIMLPMSSEAEKQLGTIQDRLDSLIGFDPLLYGFGLGTEDLRTFRNTAFDKLWRVTIGETADHERVHNVTLIYTTTQTPHIVYQFNDDRGFLLCNVRSFSKGGELTGEVKTTVEKKGGVWLPTAAEWMSYQPAAQNNGPQKRLVEKVSYQYSKINEAVDPEIFKIDALRIPADKGITQVIGAKTVYLDPSERSATTRPLK